MADRLDALLFKDERQRAAFEIMSATADLHEAIRSAEQDSPEVALLLRRLAVEEPALDADGVVMQLVRTASRRALADLESEARLSPDAHAELASVTTRVSLDVMELEQGDADAALAASARLLAWLVGRVEENA